MKYHSVIGVFAMVCLAASSAWGQSDEDQTAELRRLIQALGEKLEAVENAARGDGRVTQLGGRPRPMGAEPVMVVRIYDLSDLFAMAPSYPATVSGDLGQEVRPLFSTLSDDAFTGGAMGMGGFGGGMGGGGFFSLADKPASLPDPSRGVLRQLHAGSTPSVRTSVDQLIEAITSTIEPESWDDVGGAGSIASLGNALLISAEEHVHEQIGTLLDSFRERWGTLRTISTRAYWLWLTGAELQSLLTVADDRKAKAEDEIEAYGLVDEAAWQMFMKQSQEADGDRPMGYRAVLTCYNGQTVHAISGGQSLVVTGIDPVLIEGDVRVASEDEEGEGVPVSRVVYRPEVSIIQEGAALQVTPIATVSGKFVVVDVRSRVVHRRDNTDGRRPTTDEADPPTSSVHQTVGAIDRPLLMTHRFSTTLRVPVDRTMLIGGMTYVSEPEPGQANLYLFLKVSVQELRDDVIRREPVSQPIKPEPDSKPKPEADAKAKRKPQDKTKKQPRPDDRTE